MSRPQRTAPLAPPSYPTLLESPLPLASHFDGAGLSQFGGTPRGAAVGDPTTTDGASASALAAADMSFEVSTAVAGASNPNAVQMGIMKGRMQGLQHELQTAKRDVRDLSERLTATSTKLNEQKVQNSALTHKYSALMSKLSATEQSEKQLEELLLAERRELTASKEAAERLQAHIDEQDETIRQLKQQVAEKPPVDPTLVAALRDRNQYLPTKEVLEKQTLLIREKDALVEQMTAAFDRLVVAQEEDETSLFVCRSAVLSAATDLDTKVQQTEHLVDNLYKLLTQFNREQEDEMSKMLLSLMNENKELWTHVTRMRYELDRSNTELAAKNKKHAESVPKDQHEYAQQQISLLEEKLKRAQTTIEKQTVAERDIEERMKDLILQLSTAKQRADTLASDLATAQHVVREREAELDAAHATVNQRTQEVQELETLQSHQAAQLRSLSDQLAMVHETFETEGRQMLRQAQSERDEALENLVRLRSDFEDSIQRLATLEKELDQRTTYFNSYKRSMEEQHATYLRSQQEELTQSRQIFERELDDLRRELAEKTTETHLLQRDLEEERAERHGAKAAIRASEEETARLLHEVPHLQALVAKAEERAKKLASESEHWRSEYTALESKYAHHSSEVHRLQTHITQVEEILAEERQRHAAHASAIEADWKDSDKSRQALQEELRRLRQRVGESDQLRSLKERMERDKEQLMSENVRLHQQYQEVQQQNVSLQQTITQLKSKAGGAQQLTSQMDDLNRRLQELPSLRQLADDARREALRAKEEVALLRQERDEMSSRLEFFLDESRSAAKKDNDLDRLFRDATSQVKRLDQQLEDASGRSAKRSNVYAPTSSYLSSSGGNTSPVQRRSPARPWRN